MQGFPLGNRRQVGYTKMRENYTLGFFIFLFFFFPLQSYIYRIMSMHIHVSIINRKIIAYFFACVIYKGDGVKPHHISKLIWVRDSSE